MQIKDVNGKTPIELCKNDRTREIVIVYSSVPLNHKEEDLKWMDDAIKG